MNNLQIRFNKLQAALTSLVYMAHKPMDEDRSNIDSTIKRFEYTFELFWKTLKFFLEEKHGIITQSPKTTLQESYTLNLINDEKIWLSMLEDRNLTSHTYNEDTADEIYIKIKLYVPILQNTFENLSKEIKKLS